MCGIIGYIGNQSSLPIIVEGLRRLEYRGYDSAGIALINGRGKIEVQKTVGKINNLEPLLADLDGGATIGMGHTRWATHGEPSTINAHPHSDCHEAILVAHNGIIENLAELKRLLSNTRHEFKSETDTEIIPHLIETELASRNCSLEEAVMSALKRIVGTYGVVVISSHEPDKIIAARMGSPVLIGIGAEIDGQKSFFVASDETALAGYTELIIRLDDGQIATLTRSGHNIADLDGLAAMNRVERIEWTREQAEKNGHPTFMHKEICEQPKVMEDVCRGRLLPQTGDVVLGGVAKHLPKILPTNYAILCACGTSYHAAQIGAMFLHRWCGIRAHAEYASQFRYQPPLFDERSLFIAVSQSGETRDTIGALEVAQTTPANIMGVVNVIGSAIAKQTEFGVYLHAGPEIGVASTKAFTGQVAVLAMFALLLGRQKNIISPQQGREIVAALKRLPEQVAKILESEDQIKAIAEEYYQSEQIIFLGQGYNWPTACEGELKLKEISYMPSDGQPAAEIKHGTLALVNENKPVVILAPNGRYYSKTGTNTEQVLARKGQVIAIANDERLKNRVKHLIVIPETIEELSPILAVIPLQLLAYHIAFLRGCNIDQPNNLAKAVTVE